MDPVSHFVFGAAVTQVVLAPRAPRPVAHHLWWIGGLAAMSPDVDIFFPMPVEDPTAKWLWHRGFTHGLAFVPVLAVACLLPLLLWKRARTFWPWVLGATAVGAFTHSPLDLPTSYGTEWFWPLSNVRPGFDWVAVIDPVPTLALIVGVAWGAWKFRVTPPAIGLALALAYVCGIGPFQNWRARSAVAEVARYHGHVPDRVRAVPTLGQLFLWHGTYEYDGRLYVVGVRSAYWRTGKVRPGPSRPLVRSLADLGVEATPERRRHFDVLKWFSDDTIVLHDASRPLIVVDGRFSRVPGEFDPFWGLNFDGDPDRDVESNPVEAGESFVTKYNPDVRLSRREFLRVLWHPQEGYIPLREVRRGGEGGRDVTGRPAR